MKRDNTFSILVAVSLAMISCLKTGVESKSSIVGGEDVIDPNDIIALSTVSILTNDLTTPIVQKTKSTCSGTLIGPHHVLTAGHCVTGFPPQIQFSLGSGLNAEPIPGLRVTRKIAHPEFQGISQDVVALPNDLGILVFEGTLPDRFKYVPLAKLTGIGVGSKIDIAGYGQTSALKPDSGILRKAETTVGSFQFGGMELLLTENFKKGLCYGDSGGPGYYKDEDGHLSLFGVTSREPRGQKIQVLYQSGQVGIVADCDRGHGVMVDARKYQGALACMFQQAGKPLKSLILDETVSSCRQPIVDPESYAKKSEDEASQLPNNDFNVLMTQFNQEAFILVASPDKNSKVELCVGALKDCLKAGSTRFAQFSSIGEFQSRQLYKLENAILPQREMTILISRESNSEIIAARSIIKE